MQKLKARLSFMTLAVAASLVAATLVAATLVAATLALPVYAQVQPDVQVNQIPQLNPIVGAPTITITNLNLFKSAALSQVGIEWSVQKPQLTQITRFNLSFEVGYQNGKSQSLTKVVNNGGARATSFTGLPGFAVGSTKTILTTIYTTPGNITVTEDFTLGLTATPPPRPQPLDITQVTRVTQGCRASQDCFEVKWSASTNFPSLQSFNSFNVKLDVTYSNGTTASGNTNATAAERKKIIAVPKPHSGNPQTAKATINAAITRVASTTVTKQTP